MKLLKNSYSLVRNAVLAFIQDDCSKMSAALAYYTVFSLPGLLVIVIGAAGVVFGAENVKIEVISQIQALLGRETAEQVQLVINQAETRSADTLMATLMGVTILLFAATSAFAQLQTSLNRIWNVEPDPRRSDLRNFMTKRLLSFGMILCVAFMLLVSLTLSTVIAVVGKHIDALMPAGWTRSLLQTAHFILSFGIIALLFAAIYQVLPDVRITWRNVFFGAFSTAFLFVIGKELIGYYLGNSHVGSAYGVASSLAILLVWVYYSSMILFFGAELTKSWVRLRGNQIRPEKGAVLVQHEIKRISVDEYEKQLEGDEVNA